MIYEKLMNIQQKLNAPKGEFNSFGKFAYRSCEGILEELKPLLKENKCCVLFSDSITEHSDRIYVSTELTLIDAESGEKITVTAHAREEEDKKGMDGSQITGASSSYARKYALGAMFAIDDNKDSDATNDEPKQAAPQKTEQPPKSVPKPTPKPALKPGEVICSECNKPIMAVKIGKNEFTVEDIVAKSIAKHGRPICTKCGNALKEQETK